MNLKLKEQFMSIKSVNTFCRVDAQHPLNLYIGRDELARYSMLLISKNVPHRISSSQIICINIGQREDGQWALSFSLSSDKYVELFCRFCEDIVISTYSIPDAKNEMNFVCDRYDSWQKMLKKSCDGLLTEAEIKGLIGELIFLQNYLIPHCGVEKALNSWIGPEGAAQDFVCAKMWYEVKATVSGSDSIQISSVEQLDSQMSGELVIVYLDTTSLADPDKVSLNKIVADIDAVLLTFDQHCHFQDVLRFQGYIPKNEYDSIAYKFNNYIRFEVGANFPAIRKKDIPPSVTDVRYRLSIPAIFRYLRED